MICAPLDAAVFAGLRAFVLTKSRIISLLILVLSLAPFVVNMVRQLMSTATHTFRSSDKHSINTTSTSRARSFPEWDVDRSSWSPGWLTFSCSSVELLSLHCLRSLTRTADVCSYYLCLLAPSQTTPAQLPRSLEGVLSSQTSFSCWPHGEI